MSFTIPANTTLFLVAYVDGEVAGTSFHADTGDTITTAEGFRVNLQRSYSGLHVVQTVVYSDQNENGEFDRDIDAPCTVNGSVVQAGPERMNFTAYGASE